MSPIMRQPNSFRVPRYLRSILNTNTIKHARSTIFAPEGISSYWQYMCSSHTAWQVTLSENVHKFAELSQRIVVERSVTSQTSLSHHHHKTTEITSSHNISNVISTSLASSDDFNDRILAELTSSKYRDSPGRVIPASADIKTATSYGSTDIELSDDGKTLTTSTSMNVTTMKSHMKHSNESVRSITSSPAQLVQSKSVDNLESCASKVCEVITIQRPLKPQTEMDFSVPYNIINNYFSVGVVSICAMLGYTYFLAPCNSAYSNSAEI